MNYPIPRSSAPYVRPTHGRNVVASRDDIDFARPLDIESAPREQAELARVVFGSEQTNTEYLTASGRLPWDADPDVVLRHAMGNLYREGQEPVAYKDVRLEYDPRTLSEAWVALVWCFPFAGVRSVGSSTRVEPKLDVTTEMVKAAEACWPMPETCPCGTTWEGLRGDMRDALSAALAAHRPY